MEKQFILFADKKRCINKRSELVAKCRHRWKFVLENFMSKYKRGEENVMTRQLENIVGCTVNLTPLAESRITKPCRIVLQPPSMNDYSSTVTTTQPPSMNDHSSTVTTTQCDPVRRSSRVRKKREILDL